MWAAGPSGSFSALGGTLVAFLPRAAQSASQEKGQGVAWTPAALPSSRKGAVDGRGTSSLGYGHTDVHICAIDGAVTPACHTNSVDAELPNSEMSTWAGDLPAARARPQHGPASVSRAYIRTVRPSRVGLVSRGLLPERGLDGPR